MIIVTKDNKEYIPLLMGCLDSQEIGEHITCIEAGNNPLLNMFGQPEHMKIHISEVRGFKGTYSFPPKVYVMQKYDTEDSWNTLNPVLPTGHMGIVMGSDPRKYKIGNGVSSWKALPFNE